MYCKYIYYLISFVPQIVPESARYYISKNNMEKGEKVIKYIAWINRTTPPSVSLQTNKQTNNMNYSYIPGSISFSRRERIFKQ